MILKIKISHLVALLSIIAVSFDIVYVSNLEKIFLDKNKSLTNEISSRIEDLDMSIGKSMTNATRYVQTLMSYDNKKLTKDQLMKIRDEAGVSIISIFDKDGRFYLTTGRAMDKDYELYEFYKKTVVTDTNCDNPERYATQKTKDQCMAIHGLFNEAKNRPGTVLVTKMFLSLPRNVPNKMAVSYDNKLEKFFDVSCAGDDISKYMSLAAHSHKDLRYISIYDHEENMISRVFKGEKEKIFKDINKSNHQYLVIKNKIVSIGESALANKQPPALTAKFIFSKTNINKKVMRAHLITFIFILTICSLSLIYKLSSKKRV